MPAVLENHEVHRARDGRRVDADIARYHHIGTAHGWVDVNGDRTELRDETWVSTRDHSWGVRYQVGVPVEDVAPAPVPPEVSTTVIWSPILLTRADGTRYGLHTYYQRHGFGDWHRIELQGGFEHPDGRREPYAALVPDARGRPGEPAPAGRRAARHDERRHRARPHGHRALGHRLPPGCGPVLRLRRPLARRVARRAAPRR